jgi:hypothetical protein
MVRATKTVCLLLLTAVLATTYMKATFYQKEPREKGIDIYRWDSEKKEVEKEKASELKYNAPEIIVPIRTMNVYGDYNRMPYVYRTPVVLPVMVPVHHPLEFRPAASPTVRLRRKSLVR